jgi:hypothetical protein
MDAFGFPKMDYSKSNNVEHYEDNSQPYSTKKIITIIISILVTLLFISMAFVAGYHAYYEYSSMPKWLIFLRVYVAALFAPFYLFFVFVKTSIMTTK